MHTSSFTVAVVGPEYCGYKLSIIILSQPLSLNSVNFDLIDGLPYRCQCAKTGRLIKENLKIDDNKFMISFQSRFGSEPWLQPYTDETLEKLGNKNIKHLSVITPGFSADNIETLEEINMEGREEFLESGGKKFTYIPCLNDTKEGMDLLHKLALKELAGWI